MVEEGEGGMQQTSNNNNSNSKTILHLYFSVHLLLLPLFSHFFVVAFLSWAVFFCWFSYLLFVVVVAVVVIPLALCGYSFTSPALKPLAFSFFFFMFFFSCIAIEKKLFNGIKKQKRSFTTRAVEKWKRGRREEEATWNWHNHWHIFIFIIILISIVATNSLLLWPFSQLIIKSTQLESSLQFSTLLSHMQHCHNLLHLSLK